MAAYRRGARCTGVDVRKYAEADATDRRAEYVAGSLTEGSGTITKTTSGAIGEQPVSWAARSEDARAGKTSPEELIAAAHAACFSMALSRGLAKAGTPPDELKTSATVTFQPGEGITKIALTVEGHGARHRRRRLPRGRGDGEGELPGLEGARRRARDHAGRPATLTGGMAADFDNLIDELEHQYLEVQERMSDPSVYNDHREAAEVGRKLKELEGPYKRAQEWRAARDDLEAARDDSDLEGARARARGADGAARGGAAALDGAEPTPPTPRT